MKRVLIDTNILIDHLRGLKNAVSFLNRLISHNRTVYCSVITRIELLAGMRTDEESTIRNLLGVFEEIAVDARIAETAAVYMNRYSNSHGLNTADAIIAASSKNSNAVLYTLNTKHFPMDDIDIIRPYLKKYC